MTPVGVVAIAVEGTIICACAGGAPRVLLAEVLLWSWSVPHSRVAPMLAEGSAAEEIQGLGSTAVRAVPGTFAQDVAGSHRTGAVPEMAV